MQVPSWPVVRFADLEPGSCFLDEDSYGRQISVAVAMEEKVGGKEPFGWIDLFSENPQKSPGVLMGAARESVGHALHLDGADVDFEEASDNLLNIQSIHPYSHGAEKRGFRRPGVLMIAGDDYRVFASDGGELTASLRNGSVFRESTSDMIIVSRWRWDFAGHILGCATSRLSTSSRRSLSSGICQSRSATASQSLTSIVPRDSCRSFKSKTFTEWSSRILTGRATATAKLARSAARLLKRRVAP
jgi:hypothetical protein